MRLVRNGVTVRPGDMLVEFDRQEQLRNALDRRAELTDLEQQIRRRRAEEVAATASDDSTLKQAESTMERTRLELVKNEMLPKIEAEKNTLAHEEAQAKLKQLQETYDLKRKAAAADIKVLEIRRNRSETNMQQAESNADHSISSPLPGVAVIKTTWKNGGNMVEFAEGDEVRSGQPVVEVVNPAVMRVRARVNQADINELKTGQPVYVGLDAYPELSFSGTVTQISPIGQPSTLSPKVRNFIVLVLVKGAHPA
jgi:HlyD family secretion protein